jgi:hypothetical protein
MLAQMNKQTFAAPTHTSAGELYRRKEKENRTEIVHCLCQYAAEKREKVKKKRQCFADQKIDKTASSSCKK